LVATPASGWRSAAPPTGSNPSKSIRFSLWPSWALCASWISRRPSLELASRSEFHPVVVRRLVVPSCKAEGHPRRGREGEQRW